MRTEDGAEVIDLELYRGRGSAEQKAAWLPAYLGPPLRYPDRTLPQHGDEVEFEAESQHHPRGRFDFYRATKIFRAGTATGSGLHRGFVCRTGQNAHNKHDDRIFFGDPEVHHFSGSAAASFRVDYDLLLKSYDEQRDHAELQQAVVAEPKPVAPEWSRHTLAFHNNNEGLRDKSLVWAIIEGNRPRLLLPVQISRRLFEAAPLELLPPSLHPATSLEQLSPADRVFGWVNQKGPGAWRGALRVGHVRCETSPKDAIESFGDVGLPLGILSGPKPTQSRFYASPSAAGAPFPAGQRRAEVGYANGRGLRGRKVYPQQAQQPAYWEDPLHADVTEPVGRGQYREYLRPDGARDSQNRSVCGWVKAGTTFTTTLHVDGLTGVELGALAALLGGDGALGVGGGKPFGFGSLQFAVTGGSLSSGAAMAEAVRTFGEGGTDAAAVLDDRRAEFAAAVEGAYGPDPEFVRAVAVAMTGRGPAIPTRYPRAAWRDSFAPDANNFSYKWFAANDLERQGENGQRASLPALTGDDGLPNTP